MTDAERLQLNRIFNTLLIDIERIGNFDLRSEDRDQVMNLLRTAVAEAVGAVGQRCSRCDGHKLLCVDCGSLELPEETAEMMKGWIDD